MRDAHCMRCGTRLETRDIDDEGTPRARQVCADCGWIFYDNPTPVVAAIVEHRSDVILVRQPGWPAKFFGLVTGFLEKDEDPSEAVVREVKEELGLDAVVQSFVGHYPFSMRNELLIAYHVRAEGEIALGAELEAFKRIAPEKLRPWPMGTGHAVRDWLASRAASIQG
ncbi:MAG: NUDIX domain-containing protein [Sandaracinaceae bacterium]